MAEQEELKLVIKAEFDNENEFDRVEREINQLVRKVRDAKGQFKKGGGALTLVDQKELARLKSLKAELNTLVGREKSLRSAIEATTKAEVDFEKASKNAGRTRTETAKRVRAENVALAKQTRTRLDDIRREKRELRALIELRDTSPRERDERGRFKKIDRRPDRRLRFLLEKEAKLTQELETAREGIRREDAKIADFKADQVRQAQLLTQAERQIVATADKRFASERKKLASERGTVLRLQEEQSLRKASLRLAKAERTLAADRLALPGERLSPVDRLAALTEFNSAQADLARIVKSSNAQVKKQNEFFNRLKGTVRGVVVGLVVYRGLTRSIDAIRFGLTEAVGFGNALENAELSVAGLISGASDIATSQGEILQGAEKFSEALRISKDEIQEIRQAAIGTTATFEQLLAIYQQNVSQALGAGLDLGQFREVALLFSQGATLLGVPQTQLAEEIRSVLQGTIRPRDTRIATALGITNEQVRNAKQAGQLFELIQERFSGIAEASDALGTTLPVIVSDLKDAVQIAGAEGARELRAELLQVGKDVRSVLRTEEGQAALSGFIARILEPVRDLGRIFDEVKVPAAEFFGLLLTLLGEVVQSLGLVLLPFQDVFRLLNTGLAGVVRIFDVLQGLVGNQVVQTVLRAVATFASLQLAIGAVTKAVQSLTLVKRLEAAAAASQNLSFALGRGVGKLDQFSNGFLLANKSALKYVASLTAIVLTVETLEKQTGAITALGARVQFAAKAFTTFATSRTFSGDANVFATTAEETYERLETRLRELVEAQKEFQENLAAGQSFREASVGVNQLESQVGELANQLRELGVGLSADFLLEKYGFQERKGIVDRIGSGIAGLLAGIESQFSDSGEKSGDLFAAGAISSLFDSAKIQKELRDFSATLSERGAVARSEANESFLAPALKLLLDAKKQQVQLNEKIVVREREIREQLNSAGDDVAKVTALEKQLEEIARRRAEAEKTSLRLVQARLQILAQEKAVIEPTRVGGELAKAAINPFGPLADVQFQLIDATEKIAANLEEQGRVSRTIQQTERDRARIQKELETGFEGETSAGLKLLDLADQEVRNQKARLLILQAQNVQLENQAARARTLVTLGAVGRGGAAAVESLSSQLTNAALAENLFTNLFTTLQSGIKNAATTALQAAFTGEDVDYEQLARRLGQELANQLVNALVDKFIFQPLLNTLSELFGLQLFNNIALESNTLAINANTAALMGSQAAGLAARAGAAGLRPDLFGVGFGGVDIGNFAEGGAVSGENALAKAPAGLDSRDTVPAFLRPGEYVATPEMERRAPGLFYALEKLRRGVHSLPNFGKLRNAPRGFATGGPVDGTLRSADSFSGSAQGATVVPVLVTDERGMRKIHDNPQFVAGINKRTNQQAMRTLNRRPMR